MTNTNIKKSYKVLGIMSGSSLDGLDLAFCTFSVQKDRDQHLNIIDWELLKADTLAFSSGWKKRLADLPKVDGLRFMQAHTQFGHYTGLQVNHFLTKHQLEPDFIAFHGHTIFHDPPNQLTVQIGDGSAVAAVTTFPVINNFRHQDVASGGEGAPIAAIADKYLLPEFDFCLNLGGIANVTAQLPHKTLAFDICPANQILNVLASKMGMEYDDQGKIAASGQVHSHLLEQLNQPAYYQKAYPKTLDNFWGGQYLLPKIEASGINLADQMRTAVEHIAQQIDLSLKSIIEQERLEKSVLRLLPSGGGVFNTFLIDRIKKRIAESTNIELHLPEPSFAAFKEAILMALMGVLRVENVPNVLHSVTGARINTIGGSIHQGQSKFI